MATLNVLQPFKLNTPTGQVEFAAGIQEVDDEIAGHWFVQAHAEPVEVKASVKTKAKE